MANYCSVQGIEYPADLLQDRRSMCAPAANVSAKGKRPKSKPAGDSASHTAVDKQQGPASTLPTQPTEALGHADADTGIEGQAPPRQPDAPPQQGDNATQDHAGDLCHNNRPLLTLPILATHPNLGPQLRW